MTFELGLCYRFTAVNGEILEFKFIGDVAGYPEGELVDGTRINLLDVGAFRSVVRIDCPHE